MLYHYINENIFQQRQLFGYTLKMFTAYSHWVLQDLMLLS